METPEKNTAVYTTSGTTGTFTVNGVPVTGSVKPWHGVKISAAEEMLFGAHAPIVRKLGEAAQALRQAREIASTYLNESLRIDEYSGEKDKVPVVKDRTEAFRYGNAQGPAWVQTGNGEDTSNIVSENTAYWMEAFAFLWTLEDPVEKAHRQIAMEGGSRNDAERSRIDSKPATPAD